jgi:ribosomal protein S18 acetylase RimI-like enzyme
MQGLMIRPATLEDAKSMFGLENSCFVTDKISFRQIKYLLIKAKAINLVAEKNGHVVAYCICLTPLLPRPARLYSIAVAPEWQGNGIAEQLIHHLLSMLLAKGYRHCRLEVRQSQKNTQSLYQKLGFVKINHLPQYYGDGEAGLKMDIILCDQNKLGITHS